ncbi:Cysteine protease [Phytophthora megakarya]|uniref:Cysteine protease n=1 Tax=Phytophthora megakarya TaxID=4795 RepID=A0A225ULU0_9STRA|nr:Cysteine protease [Phytophthora megakarya]
MGRKTHVREQWEIVHEWKRKGWTIRDAVRVFKKNRTTLLLWKDKYWDMDQPPPECGDRYRMRGAGRPYVMHEYEQSVLEYLNKCLQEDGKISHETLLAYYRTKPEFLLLTDSGQRTRVSRFMRRFNPNTPNPSAPDATLSPNVVVEAGELDDGGCGERQGIVEGGSIEGGDAHCSEKENGKSSVGHTTEHVVEDSIIENVERAVDVTMENHVDNSVEDDVDNSVEDDVDKSVEDDMDKSVEDDMDSSVEEDVDSVEEESISNVAATKRSSFNLQSIDVMFSNGPCYGAFGTFKSFGVYKFTKTPKIRAYKLKISTRITPPEELEHILPYGVIRTCAKRISVLQGKSKNLAEKDVVLEVEGVGILSRSSLTIMKNWHSGMNAFEALECAIQFLDEKDINIVVHSSYLVSTDSRLVKKLKKIPISSKKVKFLECVGSFGTNTMLVLDNLP